MDCRRVLAYDRIAARLDDFIRDMTRVAEIEITPVGDISDAFPGCDIAVTCTPARTIHAIAANLMRIEDLHAELGQIIAGQRPGRTTADQIFVFDSTGTALQDVAAAAMVYQRALAAGRGRELLLDGA